MNHRKETRVGFGQLQVYWTLNASIIAIIWLGSTEGTEPRFNREQSFFNLLMLCVVRIEADDHAPFMGGGLMLGLLGLSH